MSKIRRLKQLEVAQYTFVVEKMQDRFSKQNPSIEKFELMEFLDDNDLAMELICFLFQNIKELIFHEGCAESVREVFNLEYSAK